MRERRYICAQAGNDRQGRERRRQKRPKIRRRKGGGETRNAEENKGKQWEKEVVCPQTQKCRMGEKGRKKIQSRLKVYFWRRSLAARDKIRFWPRTIANQVAETAQLRASTDFRFCFVFSPYSFLLQSFFRGPARSIYVKPLKRTESLMNQRNPSFDIELRTLTAYPPAPAPSPSASVRKPPANWPGHQTRLL